MTANRFCKGDIFHVFNKSIASYGIFKDLDNAQRFIHTLHYYNNQSAPYCFSEALRKEQYTYQNLLLLNENSIIKFIAYCIMPDHYHLLIKVSVDNRLSKYISDVENSFSRYFNIRFERKGPLWQSRFKSKRIKNNEQLLHVSRYIHLNPTTSYLVDKPEDWFYSSYEQLITDGKLLGETLKEISISSPKSYKKFVEDNKNYQRQLGMIKKLLLE